MSYFLLTASLMIVCTTQYPYLIYDSAHIIGKNVEHKIRNIIVFEMQKRTKIQNIIVVRTKDSKYHSGSKCKNTQEQTRMKKTRQQYESTNISGILYTQGKRTTSGMLLLGFLIYYITLQSKIFSFFFLPPLSRQNKNKTINEIVTFISCLKYFLFSSMFCTKNVRYDKSDIYKKINLKMESTKTKMTISEN
jgi:hypothetical protein